MSEWLKEHAWKATRAILTESHQNTRPRIPINRLPLKRVLRCDAVNVGVRRRLRADLTQFLHNSDGHLLLYALACANTRQFTWPRDTHTRGRRAEFESLSRSRFRLWLPSTSMSNGFL